MLRQLALRCSTQSRLAQAARRTSSYHTNKGQKTATYGSSVAIFGGISWYIWNQKQDGPTATVEQAQLIQEAKTTEEIINHIEQPQIVAAFTEKKPEQKVESVEAEPVAAEKGESKVDEVIEKVEEAVEKTGEVVKDIEKTIEAGKEAVEAIEEAGEAIVEAVSEVVSGTAETEPQNLEAPATPNVQSTDGNPFSEPAPRTEEEVATALDEQVKTTEQIKADLLSKFADVRMTTAQKVKAAIGEEKVAADKIHCHTLLIRIAMDEQKYNPGERAGNWQNAEVACEEKGEANKAAAESNQAARRALLEYRGVLNQITADYPDLADDIILGEDHYVDMRNQLNEAEMDKASKITEAEVTTRYTKLVEEARDQFAKQMFSEESLPDALAKIKDGWLAQAEPERLDSEQLNALLAHAVMQKNALQDELQAERARVVEKMQEAVTDERLKLMDEAATKVELETEQRFAELQRMHEERILKIRKQYEEEVILQLRRQTASHVAHIGDVVLATESETSDKLQKCHEIEKSQILEEFDEKFGVQEASNAEKFKEELVSHETQLGLSLAQLQGVNDAFTEHTEIEGRIDGARRLAVAARSLVRNVMQGGQSLAADVATISKHGNEATGEVLERVVEANRDILDRGVVSQKDLRKRFYQMIDDLRKIQFLPNECSLPERVLEISKSELLYKFDQLPLSLQPPAQVGELQSPEVLAYATYCVEQGDIEQAARFMAQLNGQAARRSANWTVEACRYVEFKQASKAIATIAEAVSLGMDNFA